MAEYIYWDGATANWDVATNWSSGTLPAGQIAAFVDHGSYTVTLSDAQSVAGAEISNSFGGDAFGLDITSTGSLALNGGSFSDDGGTLQLAGTLSNGTLYIEADGGGYTGTVLYQGGTLTGITVQGTLDLSPANSVLNVTGGLVLEDTSGNQPGTVTLTGENSVLNVLDNETLDHATITIGTTGGDDNGVSTLEASGALVLGPSLTINETGGESTSSTLSGAGTIDNQGTISLAGSDGFGADMVITAAGFTNDGQITATNSGVLFESSNTTNNGSITLSQGAIVLFGDMAGSGSITMQMNGEIIAAASGTLASTLVLGNSDALMLAESGVTLTTTGAISGSGTLDVGSPENGAVVLSGDNAAFSRTMVIIGGTLELASATAAGSGSIAFGGSSGTLKVDAAALPVTVTPITGFVSGDLIDLASLGFAAGSTTATLDGSTVVVTDGSATDTLTLTGLVAGTTIYTSSDGTAGTDLSLTAPPVAAPTGLGLAVASDTGVQGDGITSVAMPSITGTGTAGDTVTVDFGSTVLGTVTVLGDGSWSLTPATTLADGIYQLTATQTDTNGDTSASSAAFALTVDTTTPAAPGLLVLSPASDSGVAGDDITNVVTPTITGSGEVGDTVTLYAGGMVVGTGIVAQNSAWSVTPGTALSSGTDTLTATQTDLAGNTSVASLPLVLTIDLAATAPSLVEVAAATAPATPLLTGAGEAGDVVSIYNGTILLGTTTVGNSGSYSFTVPTTLTAGTYALTATEADAAGNVSPASPTLSVKVASDGSYAVVTGTDAAGNTTARAYNAAGVLTATTTTDNVGLLLQSVSATATVRNIYDSDGRLIGTVAGPGSADGNPPQPGFDTTRQVLSASTATDGSGSVVTLLSESNSLTTAGNDTVSAGAGSDTIFAAGATTSVTGGSGSLLVVVTVGITTVTGGTGSSTVFGGTGGGSYQGGSAGNNVLIAGSGNTSLFGGGGGDVLVGGSGTNLLVLTGSNGVAFGGTGSSLFFGASNGLMIGGSTSDIEVAGSGPEGLYAGTGTSVLYAGTGADTLTGGTSGHATMVGGTGGDLFVGAGGTDVAFGGTGNDTFYTGPGSMLVMEGGGTDQVVFGSGSATVLGGSGNDLYTVVSGSAGGQDVIQGFKVGTDHLQLSGYATGSSSIASAGGNTTVSLTDGTRVTLLGVSSLNSGSII